jgi:hypothetical protein
VRRLEDLHPSEPSAYRSTRPQSLLALPPTLRRLHLQWRKAAEARQAQDRGAAAAAGGDGGRRGAGDGEVERMMTYVPPRCDLGDVCGYRLTLKQQCVAT